MANCPAIYKCGVSGADGVSVRRAKVLDLRILLAVLVLCAAPADAFAYLDPGTGSLLLQGLIASVATGIIVLRARWHQFRDFILRKPKTPDSRADQRDER